MEIFSKLVKQLLSFFLSQQTYRDRFELMLRKVCSSPKEQVKMHSSGPDCVLTANIGLQSIIDKTFATSIAVVRDSCKYSVGRLIVLICFKPDYSL